MKRTHAAGDHVEVAVPSLIVEDGEGRSVGGNGRERSLILPFQVSRLIVSQQPLLPLSLSSHGFQRLFLECLLGSFLRFLESSQLFGLCFGRQSQFRSPRLGPTTGQNSILFDIRKE